MAAATTEATSKEKAPLPRQRQKQLEQLLSRSLLLSLSRSSLLHLLEKKKRLDSVAASEQQRRPAWFFVFRGERKKKEKSNRSASLAEKKKGKKRFRSVCSRTCGRLSRPRLALSLRPLLPADTRALSLNLLHIRNWKRKGRKARSPAWRLGSTSQQWRQEREREKH